MALQRFLFALEPGVTSRDRLAIHFGRQGEIPGTRQQGGGSRITLPHTSPMRNSGPTPSFPDWALLGEWCHTGGNYEGVRVPCQVIGLVLAPRGALYSSGHLLPFASLTLTLIFHCKEVSRVGYEGPLSLCPWALLAYRTLWPPTTGRKRLG